MYITKVTTLEFENKGGSVNIAATERASKTAFNKL